MIWQVSSVLAFIATLVFNTLATTGAIGGRTTAAISNAFPVVFTPANYVFSIWSVIYLGLLAFVVYQVLPAGQRNARLSLVRPLFVLSCVFNSTWIIAWQNEYFALSMLLMLGLLATLVAIYNRLKIGLKPASGSDFWLVNGPFSVYLGWISVATIANACVVLYSAGWTGGGIPWSVVLIAVATVLGLAFLNQRADVSYALVLVWALVGIAVRNWGIPVVAYSALLGAAILVLVIGLRGRRTQLAVPSRG